MIPILILKGEVFLIRYRCLENGHNFKAKGSEKITDVLGNRGS